MADFYILRSLKTNRYYLGSTNNIKARVCKHNSGSVRSTKAYRPWKLVFKETFASIRLARQREKQVKSWKNKFNIERLIKMALSSIG